MPQSFFKSVSNNDHFNVPSAGKKPTTIKAAQKALGNIILPSIIATKNPIKVNKNPNHNMSEDEKNIAAKIAQLRKKQKKAQMKSKLSQLWKQTTQGFVKNIPEKDTYAQ